MLFPIAYKIWAHRKVKTKDEKKIMRQILKDIGHGYINTRQKRNSLS